MDNLNVNQLSSARPSSPAEVRVVDDRNSKVSSSAPPVDKLELSSQAVFASSLVETVSQMPAVRSEVVDSFRTKIVEGNYPPPAIVNGLTRLMGGEQVIPLQ